MHTANPRGLHVRFGFQRSPDARAPEPPGGPPPAQLGARGGTPAARPAISQLGGKRSTFTLHGDGITGSDSLIGQQPGTSDSFTIPSARRQVDTPTPFSGLRRRRPPSARARPPPTRAWSAPV